MQLNFFQWVREGVKQSVLLGVSDAVEHLGQPDSGDDVQKRLTAALKSSTTGTGPKKSSTSTQRKRLGRTLKDVSAAEKEAA